jgi:hypothetical protein
MGIEPTSEAWEASILPLYDARSFLKLTKVRNARKGWGGRHFREIFSVVSVSRIPRFTALAGKLLITEAFNHVIVDDPGCLHQCVADRRSYETKTTLLQFLAQGLRQWRFGRK